LALVLRFLLFVVGSLFFCAALGDAVVAAFGEFGEVVGCEGDDCCWTS